MEQQEVPSALIIGAAKAGTTALFQYFSQHPDIFVANPKEPNYFAFAGQEVSFAGPGDDVTINAKSVVDRDEYRRLFSDAGQAMVTCEGSVSTLYYGEDAAHRLDEEAPHAKLICMLRNPADRAWSAFNFMRSRLFEPEESFLRALDLEEERIAAGYHHMWHYKAMGRYAAQLRHFSGPLSEGRLKVVLYEDFGADSLSVLRSCFEFLEVSTSFEPTFTPAPHRSGEPRIKWLSKQLSRDTHLKDRLKPLIPSSLRAELRSRAAAVALERRQLDKELRHDLALAFEDDVCDLEELIGRDLSEWKPNPV